MSTVPGTPGPGRVSVAAVVPTHRRADLLRQALAAIAAQTDPADEVVVVSDVPDDAARAAAAEAGATYLERDPGAPGASASRNAGAAATTAEVLAFLDDDDLWAPGYLAGVRAALGSADAVVTWMTMFDERSEADGASVPADLVPADVLARNPGTTGSNLAVRRAAFEAVGGFDPDLSVKNDTDLFYRFLAAGHGYAVQTERLVRQRRHASGQLTAHSHMRADGVERYIAKHRAALTRAQLRHLRFSIARMRRNASSGRLRRTAWLLRAASLYSWPQFLRDRRARRDVAYYRVAEFDDLRATR